MATPSKKGRKPAPPTVDALGEVLGTVMDATDLIRDSQRHLADNEQFIEASLARMSQTLFTLERDIRATISTLRDYFTGEPAYAAPDEEPAQTTF